jgi:RNA ligase (TIGR02306 family)
MSAFAVTIKRIRAIEKHPSADAIELCVIDGYRSIVKKGEYRAGDLVAYIPEASILPEWLLKRMGFWDAEKNIGKLHGKEGNRVRAIKLRGELSQGICYPVIDGEITGELYSLSAAEDDDVTWFLGITKWEPPIPVGMAGEVFNAGQHLTVAFDVENWKSYPDILQDGEEVIFTEKLHGTFCGITVLPRAESHEEAFGEHNNILIWSKGLGAQGLVFKNNERNTGNLYVRATRMLTECLRDVNPRVPMHLMGEVFGPGVQDLPYGNQIGFRLFAVADGYRGDLVYCDFETVEDVASSFAIETVPVLYRGPYSEAEMRKHTDGKTTLCGGHIREGIVMVPAKERWDSRIGRVCLKSVSADYLTRKGGTEHN